MVGRCQGFMISFCLRLGNNLVRRLSTNATRQKVNTCSKLMLVHGCPQFKTQQNSCRDWLVKNYGPISSFSLVNCSFMYEQLSPTFSSWLLMQKYSRHAISADFCINLDTNTHINRVLLLSKKASWLCIILFTVVEKYCLQPWTIWAVQHCPILFLSNLNKRYFLPCIKLRFIGLRSDRFLSLHHFHEILTRWENMQKVLT